MARDGLRLLVCAGLLLSAGAPPARAQAGDDAEGRKFLGQLAVQRALEEGRARLKRGDFAGAVAVLECQVSRINGSHEYLDALRDAYRGLVRDLVQAGRAAEAGRYQERLDALDPPAGVKAAPAARPTVTEGRPQGAAPAPTAVRGQSADGPDDPFAAGNAREAPPGRALLEKAEKEWSGRHYDAAGRLYEQVARAEPALLDGCRDRWAYCKLCGVADALNRPGAGPGAGQDLEREVRLAMSLAPQLDGVGKDLLRKIQERRGQARGQAPDADEAAAAEVRHLPRQGGWSVAETANFRILHNQPREVVEQVARVAEATRSAMIRKWFGDPNPAWSPRCDLVLHATAQDYSQATGVPPASPGHSTMHTEGERVVSRRIDLHCDDPNMFVGVLPHETTHVVLAGRFGGAAVPRWADEGMAVLAEPRERIERHLRNLPRHRQNHELFPVGQLMRLDAYPDPRYVGSFYAESVSLVEFLSREKGPREFAVFLREGLQGGYEPALQRHYGYRSFAELEAAWQQYAFGGPSSGPAVAGRDP
jgi:hypothetical protein